MRKIRKRVFAAVLAAALLFTIPGMSSAAEAETVQSEDISESATVQSEDDADLSCCEGEKTENRFEENKEDAEQGDTGAQDTGANLCAHHKEHTQDCGYSPASEDGEGSPCTYECRICPIEDLIATLPGEVTAGNAEKVRAQLNKILAFYRELSEDEQEQIDLSRCLELQEALDAANIPAPIDEPTEGEGTAENLWQCGDNVTATLEGGTLTIRGTGNMANFGNFTSPPWEADKNTITRVVIEPGVTSIGKMAFSGHRALQSVEIPTGVTEIGFNAFNYCTALQSVTIPGSVKTIGESAFSCSGLTEVTIPEGVTLIDFSAFQQCSSLTKAVIPASVTEIGQQAFYGCSRLIEVTFAGQTAPTLGNDAFDNPSGGFPGSTLTIIVPTGAVGYTAENGWPIVAQVETAGGTTCYGDFTTAWAAAKSAGTATITLLADVTASDTLAVDAGSTITLKGGDYTLTSGQVTAIQVNGTLKLESGTVKSTCSSSQAKGINVSGTLEMTGGAVTTSENIVSGSMAVRADSGGTITVSGGKISGVYGILVNGGTVTIQNGEISGQSRAIDVNTGTVTIEGGTFTGRTYYGLKVGSGGTAVLRGGTFTGGNMGYAIDSKTALSGLLDQTQPFTYYAYFENGKPVALEDGQTSLDGGTFTVGECNHEGGVRDNGDGTHGGDCPYCGAELGAAPHTLGDGNKCEGCGATLVAQVQTRDGTIVYLGEGDFANAFNDRKYNNVTVTLLSDIQVDSIEMGDTQASVHVLNTSTLDLAGHTITSSDTAIYVYPTGNLTIQDSSSSKTGQVVSISSAAILTQTGMVSLTGGTYTGIPTIDGKASSTNVSSLLANYGTQTTPHYAYFNAQGNPIALGENQRELTGTVTVGECKHEGVEATPNNNGTHSLKCPYCGYTAAAENCSYGTEYQHDDTNHWQICTVCGYKNKEAHTLKLAVKANGTVITASDTCDCGYQKDLGTVTLTVPTKLTYNDGQTIAWKASDGLNLFNGTIKARWLNESGETEGNQKQCSTDTPIPVTFLPLPDFPLPAGNHSLLIEVDVSTDSQLTPNRYASCTIPVTIGPAELTDSMVKYLTNVFYNGIAQKPDFMILQGESRMLAEGTDYDVAYSTTDFTNAGTIIITITGKGNYKGTVEKTYTIKKAVLEAAGTGIANGTYGAKLSELSVTGLKAVFQGTATEVPGTWKLAGSTVPAVGDTGTYTAAFTPASGAGNYEPLTAQVKLKIEKANAPAPPEGTLHVQNNREQSYQYDLTQLLPALESGKSYGTVRYTLEESAVNISGGYYTDGAKITGTTLILPIQKVEDNKEGNIGEVSITITSRNYKDMTAMIAVRGTNSTPVTITGVSMAGRAYNGRAVECTGTPKAVESDGSTAAISVNDYQYTWKTADGTVLSGAPKDAGSYLLTVSVDNGAYTGSSTISFVINKAGITITANSMTVNKGSAKPTLTYTISGLAEKEKLNMEPTLTCNADMNTAGRYPITVSGAEVPNSGNYHTEITYVPGALTVTASTSGGGSGSSGGNTAPGGSAIPAVTDTNTNQGTDADTVKPGTGNKARQGIGTKSGSSAAKEERPDTGIPFIKGEDGKIGWNVILAEEEKAEDGSVINVDMNGTAVVPGNIFDNIKGRDITITFDMGNGIIWSVDGKSITRDASRDKAEDIDFTVRMGGNTVPVESVNRCFANNVTGERYSIQLSLAHDGEFGFIAVLSVNLGEENAGYLASLYYYNEDTGELEFICADEVAQDGTVSFAFTHASDYVVVVDRIAEEESDTEGTEQAKRAYDAQTQDRTDGNGGAAMGSSMEAQSRNLTGFIIVGIIALAGIGAGVFTAVRKKKEKEE